MTNPRVVVEVLTDGTEAYDHGQKLDHYRGIPSLAAVVLVSHRTPAIEVWERASDGAWSRREFGTGQAAEIEALPRACSSTRSISDSSRSLGLMRVARAL